MPRFLTKRRALQEARRELDEGPLEVHICPGCGYGTDTLSVHRLCEACDSEVVCESCNGGPVWWRDYVAGTLAKDSASVRVIHTDEDTDPRVLEVLEADEKLRVEVEEAWRLMHAHFPEAEIELEYSVEMDEGADPNDFQVAVVAYTSNPDADRLRRLNSAWVLTPRQSTRILFDAELAA